MENTTEVQYTNPITGVTSVRQVRGLHTGCVYLEPRPDEDEQDLVFRELEASYVQPSAQEIAMFEQDIAQICRPMQRQGRQQCTLPAPTSTVQVHINHTVLPGVFESLLEEHGVILANGRMVKPVIRTLQPFINMENAVADTDKQMTLSYLKSLMWQCGLKFIDSRGDELTFQFDHTDVFAESAQLKHMNVFLKVMIAIKAEGVGMLPPEMRLKVRGMPLWGGIGDGPTADDLTICTVENYWLEEAKRK